MTVRDVAAFLNVNEKTVYRLAQRRELPGFKVAGGLVEARDVNEWSPRSEGAGLCPKAPQRSPTDGQETRRVESVGARRAAADRRS
jgi:excisionase family DNA binding protein